MYTKYRASSAGLRRALSPTAGSAFASTPTPCSVQARASVRAKLTGAHKLIWIVQVLTSVYRIAQVPISIEPVLIGVDHEHTSAYNRHERMYDNARFPDVLSIT